MTDWLSTEDAAGRLDLTPIMVRKLIERGQVIAERFGAAGRGGRWMVSAADVDRLARERAANPPRSGRPLDTDTPSAAALAKRKSRARQKEQL